MIVTVFIIIGIINIFFIDRFYILNKRESLNKVYREISLKDINDVIRDIDYIEDSTSTIIVYTKLHNDIDKLNQDIFNDLYNKRIRLNKFWITKETLMKLDKTSVNTIYNQQFIKYKFYTKVFKKGEYIFVVGTTLADIEEIISIVNIMIIFICITSVLFNWVLVQFNIGMITRHIKNIRDQSLDISNLKFTTKDIKTCDEIEELSRGINYMSNSLRIAHEEINSQNDKLKGLLCDVSHEVKTPLSIIKVYIQGIEDGLDDGSYINVIYDEIYKIDSIIEKLLFYFKIRDIDNKKGELDLLTKIIKLVKKYEIIFRDRKIELSLNYDEDTIYYIVMNEEHLDIVLENLITNSIKYTKNNRIEIYLYNANGKVRFSIINGIGLFDIDVEKLWIPFYVREKSRDKNFSGTGLGLPIVREILDKYKFHYGISCVNTNFEFYIDFVE